MSEQQIDIKVITLGGIKEIKTNSGITVAELREQANLASTTKIVNESSEILKDKDIVTESCNLFISVPKQNA